MKYKTFRGLLFGGLAVLGVAGIAGAYVACDHASEEPSPTAKAEVTSKSKSASDSGNASKGSHPVQSPSDPGASTTDADLGAATLPLSPRDEAILARVRQGVSGDKVKDAIKGAAYKVNLYNEAGKIRAKVDLNRNEKWDEKWSFESTNPDEGVKRQIATKDDEVYDLEYRLDAGHWRKKE